MPRNVLTSDSYFAPTDMSRCAFLSRCSGIQYMLLMQGSHPVHSRAVSVCVRVRCLLCLGCVSAKLETWHLLCLLLSQAACRTLQTSLVQQCMQCAAITTTRALVDMAPACHNMQGLLQRKTMTAMKKMKHWTGMRHHRPDVQWQVCNTRAPIIIVRLGHPPVATRAQRRMLMTGTSLGLYSMWSGLSKMTTQRQHDSQRLHNVRQV